MSFERATASPIINECDDYAIDEAVRLRKLCGGKVRALTVGGLRCGDVLLQAIAKGADDAVRIDGEGDDPMGVAACIAAYVSQNSFDLIITGVESADEMASAVGPAVAALLDRPFATSVTRIEHEDGGMLVVDKEMGGGHIQRLAITLPAVLAVQSGICRLTYAPTARILQARRTPPRSVSRPSLGVESGAVAAISEIRPPRRERAADMIDGATTDIAVAVLDRIERALQG